MNALGLALIEAAARVTALGLAAWLLVNLLGRRKPAGTPPVLAFLVGGAALTVLAFFPLPGWWRWESLAPSSEAGTGPPKERTLSGAANSEIQSASDASGAVLPLAWWRAVQTSVASSLPREEGVAWPGLVAWAFLAGMGVGLGRLGLGLWAVLRCRRQGRVIREPGLVRVLGEVCRAVGYEGAVEVRECADLGGPATVGWWRPVLLLPAGWRAWGEAELRAVLAHEAAHVRRRDYLAWLAARVSVAVQFYHPLVHWAARRLHLEQELAADALAARAAGGREVYLRALAALALRREGGPVPWPARALFSTHGTLLRRIAMLRAKDRVARPVSGRLRVMAAGLLLALAAGTSAVRGRADDAGARVPDGEKAPRVPFDLTYLPADATGVVAVRPAELLGSPEMKAYADPLNGQLEQVFRSLGIKAGLGFRVGQVEQIVSPLVFSRIRDDQGGEECRTLALGLGMIRMKEKFDWAGYLRERVPFREEVRTEDGTYYKAPKVSPPLPFLFGVWFIPDERTVVFTDNEHVRALLARKPGHRPKAAWGEDWHLVERDLVAVGVKMDWVGELRAKEASDPVVAPLMRHGRYYVGGGAFRRSWVFQVRAGCTTEEGAAKVQDAWKELLRRGLANMKEAKLPKPTEEMRAAQRSFQALLESTQVKREGTRVRLHGQVPGGLAELANFLLHAERRE
jgi:beta-lactamase regulating signal transducer with metallopeptidase domain